MPFREQLDVERAAKLSLPPDLVLRTPPNWTAVAFFAALGLLHLSIAAAAFFARRWEGYLSLALAIAFVSAALVATRFRFELTILPQREVLRLRHGTRRLYFERLVSFSSVQGIRLTLAQRCATEAKLEIVCALEEIVCPPSCIPRQQALCLAMLLDVPLIKVMAAATIPDRCLEPA